MVVWFFSLEPVEIRLTCQLFVRIVVILPLREHIIDQPDGQQVEVGDADTELHTAQQKERGGHFPLTFARFFLDSTSVCTLPHSCTAHGGYDAGRHRTRTGMRNAPVLHWRSLPAHHYHPVPRA